MKSSIFWAVVVLLATGCTTSRMETPQNFVALAEGEGLKFISSDEAKLWVREFRVPEQGDLEFWTQSFLHDTVNKRGYELKTQDPVAGRDGSSDGHEMVFATLVDGRPHQYLVTLYVEPRGTGSTVRVVEFLAENKAFEEHLAEVRRVRGTLRK